ncbi:MAG: class I SAM-dependent methyltransferase [Candidatus Eisenbacteria bacterium]|uniref:Class I SAM-dependent methyltransferase n=1 Tax=Eiseniibacteriota bacterium TaxID=2212470 RepID=A0A538TXY4_UNCEI|nr:MAG: class I SAM-dependent methyltransferase [Candidatus Eisenbacteria bacterium]
MERREFASRSRPGIGREPPRRYDFGSVSSSPAATRVRVTVDPGSPPCPVCGGADFLKIFRKGGYDFWKCAGCGLERRQPLPSLAELKAWYDDSYARGLYREFAAASRVKRATATRRLGEIRSRCPGDRWLDVGCSTGELVDVLRQRGIDARGIELSGIAVAEACRRGLPVVQSTPEDYRADRAFDVVTCFDLVEHAVDPVRCLEAVHRLLAPGGRIVLTVPNQGSVIRKLMGSRWYFYIPEEHLHYFNRSTIRRLLARTGFTTERCTRARKPLSYRYALTQLAAYNPRLHRALEAIARALPQPLLDWVVPLDIGEIMVIARKR